MASRRDFLQSFRKPLEAKEVFTLRPPYALNESLFQNACTQCDSKACVASCDEEIIFISKDASPSLSFVHSGCTFCEDCANACDANVLSLDHAENSERLNASFVISTQSCVAHNGVICFSCKEPCIDDAILFNGLFNPVIDKDKCTACGFCLSRCPTEAIDFTVKPLKEIS
ncbi:Ferredoxin-type protein NapF (periplasmic nitrate reductase) [hydrothermal vent metagenome]|uniref:Ferredoxin-type protein NapF (Periplasmic nitrate reductase) n=1 Tax=hydrothermal vent metagenome TaxID=652676 RepID=A0A1W1D186_9ZZZZ